MFEHLCLFLMPIDLIACRFSRFLLNKSLIIYPVCSGENQVEQFRLLSGESIPVNLSAEAHTKAGVPS